MKSVKYLNKPLKPLSTRKCDTVIHQLKPVLTSRAACFSLPCVSLHSSRTGAEANNGMAVKMGAKGRTTRNNSPVKMAVRPVRPPTRMPAKLSPRMMTGLRPRRAERMLSCRVYMGCIWGVHRGCTSRVYIGCICGVKRCIYGVKMVYIHV